MLQKLVKYSWNYSNFGGIEIKEDKDGGWVSLSDVAEMERQWLSMIEEKLDPPPGVAWSFKIPFTRIILQKIEKY